MRFSSFFHFALPLSHPVTPPVHTDARPHSAMPALEAGMLAMVLGTAALTPAPSHAQIKTKPDGKWRQILGAGASVASGNSDLTSYNLDYDLARQTGHHTLTLRTRALYNTSDGETSANTTDVSLTGKRTLGEGFYVYANGTWFRDRIANLSHRLSGSSGFGYKLIHTPTDDWGIFAGLGYTEDRYTIPTLVSDQIRSRYGRFELTLGTESTHQLTPSTSFHQRLAVYPALNDENDLRAEFQSTLSVAINRRLALTASADLRYNRDPGTAISRMDRRFTTGISLKFVD